MEDSDNILFIDKPTNMTSHDVVNIIRRQTGVKRVGHAGTLDPLATGLLIVLVGRAATKRQSEFMKQDKEYLCRIQLGIETDTYDSQGKVTFATDWTEINKITKEDVSKILQEFHGEILQTAPAYSAIKIHGQKLYDMARKGTIDVTEIPTRTVRIDSYDLLSFHKDDKQQILEIELRVACSTGTYIRSLAFDIGRKLNVGGTITSLRRTKIGPYSVETAQAITPRH